MPPIFTIEKKEEIKIRLLEIGVEFIKLAGLRKMSVEKVTKEAGIGKGTFYHFFASKEQYIIEVIRYSKENIYKEINEIVSSNGYIDRQSFQQFFIKFSFTGGNNLLSFLSKEDMQWLRENCSEEYILDVPKEEEIMGRICQCVKGMQTDISFHVIANIMKLLGLMMEHKEELHQDSMKDTQELIVESLCDYIFE